MVRSVPSFAVGPPVPVLAEDVIRLVLLCVRHAGIERLEGRDKFLEALSMGLDDGAIGLQIVDRGHGLDLVEWLYV